MNTAIAVIFVPVIFVVDAFTAEDLWLVFKENHGKTYKNLLEEKIRFTYFKANLLRIENHNRRYETEEESYFLKITPHADLTEEEFRRRLILNSQEMSGFMRSMSELKFVGNTSEIPDSFDWRAKGVVSEVKNQKQCGSCWAFSATGALEGQNAIKNKVLLPLSEQQLLDCSSSYGNGDCQVGGLMNFAFDYIKDHGIESEEDYPYEAKMVTCRAVGSKSRMKLKAYKWVGKTEENLKRSVATVGPISVSLDATYFHLYGGGIFFKKSCSSTEANHAVLLVGYGRHRNKDYWLIKNSWGATWGEKGYMRMIRNAHNQCGIANGAVYPEIN